MVTMDSYHKSWNSNNLNLTMGNGRALSQTIVNFNSIPKLNSSVRYVRQFYPRTQPWFLSLFKGLFQYPIRRPIVRSREVPRFVFAIVRSLYNLAGTSAALNINIVGITSAMVCSSEYQTAILQITLLKINRLLSIHTSNVLLKLRFDILTR